MKTLRVSRCCKEELTDLGMCGDCGVDCNLDVSCVEIDEDCMVLLK